VATGVAAIRARLRALANPKIAAHSKRFFKTGPGEYGEGDRFLGIRVPMLRKLVREHRETPEPVVFLLLQSPLHEERLLALLMMVDRFERETAAGQKRIYDHYIGHIKKYVNNWDLVDSSAREIVGGHRDIPVHQTALLRGCARNLGATSNGR